MHRIQSKSEKSTEQDLMEFNFATGVAWNLLARAFYLSVKGNFFSFSSYEMPEVFTLPVRSGGGGGGEGEVRMTFQRFFKHNSA